MRESLKDQLKPIRDNLPSHYDVYGLLPSSEEFSYMADPKPLQGLALKVKRLRRQIIMLEDFAETETTRTLREWALRNNRNVNFKVLENIGDVHSDSDKLDGHIDKLQDLHDRFESDYDVLEQRMDAEQESSEEAELEDDRKKSKDESFMNDSDYLFNRGRRAKERKKGRKKRESRKKKRETRIEARKARKQVRKQKQKERKTLESQFKAGKIDKKTYHQERKKLRETTRSELEEINQLKRERITKYSGSLIGRALRDKPKKEVAPMRDSFLNALRMNLFGMSTRMYPAYLTDSEIKKHKLKKKNAEKSRKGVGRLEKMWRQMGGDPKELWPAIREGWMVPIIKSESTKIKLKKSRGSENFDAEYLNKTDKDTSSAIVSSAGPALITALGILNSGKVANDPFEKDQWPKPVLGDPPLVAHAVPALVDENGNVIEVLANGNIRITDPEGNSIVQTPEGKTVKKVEAEKGKEIWGMPANAVYIGGTILGVGAVLGLIALANKIAKAKE